MFTLCPDSHIFIIFYLSIFSLILFAYMCMYDDIYIHRHLSIHHLHNMHTEMLYIFLFTFPKPFESRLSESCPLIFLCIFPKNRKILYIQILIHYVVHLELIYSNLSIIPQKLSYIIAVIKFSKYNIDKNILCKL